MAFFGLFKSAKKPPAAPNYAADSAEASSSRQLRQHRQQLQLNNPNQVNPFGTQTTAYDETGTPTVTQALTPEAQSALTAQQETQKRLAESGAAAAKRYQDMISQPFNPNLAGIQTSFDQGGNIMSDPNQRLGLQSLGNQGPVSAGEQYQQDIRMGVRRPGLSRQSPRETNVEEDMRKSRFGRIGQAGQQSGGGVFDKSASGDFTGGNITNDPNTDRFGDASGTLSGHEQHDDGYQGGMSRIR
jgi:hypothetical protein